MSASIFISFAAQDRKVANTLCQALESRGFKCWISSRDILPGENFQIAIVRSIRKAKLMLLVFTANSNNSEEMNKELALASQQKLTVVPLRIEDVAPNDAFAYEFATRQWIDFFADWELAMGALASQIANVLGPDAPPAVIPGAPTAPAAVEPPVVAERVADLAGATMIAPPSFRAAPEPTPAEPAAEPVADLAPTPEPEAVQAPEPEAIAEPVSAWASELPPETTEAPATAESVPEADSHWGAAEDIKTDLADAEAPVSHGTDSHLEESRLGEAHGAKIEGAEIEAAETAPPLSAAALLSDVQAVPEKPTSASAHDHAVETPARKKGSPLPLIIGAVVLLAAAAAGVVWFLNKAPDDAAANPPVAASTAAPSPTVAPTAESAAPATPIAASPALPAAATAAPATAGADTLAATAATDAATAATAAPKAARHRPKAESGPAPLRASRSDIPY